MHVCVYIYIYTYTHMCLKNSYNMLSGCPVPAGRVRQAPAPADPPPRDR